MTENEIKEIIKERFKAAPNKMKIYETTGIYPSTLTRWFNGENKTIHISTILSLCQALDLEIKIESSILDE